MISQTDSVRQFYREFPYPSYGEQLKRRSIDIYRRYCEKPGRYLEAGCGTGHVLIGTATSLKHLDYWAIDISETSLEVARKVAADHDIQVNFRVHNLMEPLPHDFQFDYINCVGVIHHLESPEVGLRNLANHLDENGYLFLHAYGEEYHRRRFQIKEMLDIMQEGENDYETRFELFQAYVGHHRRLVRGGLLKRLYRLSARDFILPLIKMWQRRSNAHDEGSVHVWRDELENPVFSERWMDQFAHPHERTYNLREFCDLMESAGLEPVEMFSLGRYRPEHLPNSWKTQFERLSKASQYRVMELLNPSPTSPFGVARKKSC